MAGARRAAIGLAVALSLLAILGSPPSSAHATETPVAAYSFDEGEGETANDAFGENDGAVEDAEWVGGKYGTALRFDAEDEALVSIPDDPDLQLTGSFTPEAWVRPQYAQHWLPVITKETEGFFSYQLYAGGEEPGHAEAYVSKKAWEATGVAAHPEALESGKIYKIAMYLDGDHLSESAIGDTESSLFSWGVQILGSHCDSSPWCVNIDEVDIEGATLPIIKKDHEFDFDHLFEGYGPADLPGCFEFLNPELWPESGQLLGAHPCIFAT